MKKSHQKIKRGIEKLRTLFPKEIEVKIERSVDGGFIAEILTFPGCITEAETLSELIGMINDCVRTYFNVPKQHTSHMPEYLPNIDVARRFGVLPARSPIRSLTFFQIPSAALPR